MNNPTETLQHWLAEIIISPGELDHKLGQVRARYQVHEQNVIAAAKNIPARSRLYIYTSGYVARLKECLSADFPMLKKFMGDDVFDRFVAAALTHSPSKSYSLYDLGLNFIEFLTATQPKRDDLDEVQQLLLSLPVEIARVERARQEVLRAVGTESLPIPPMSAADLMFDAARIRIKLPESVRLLQLEFGLKKLLLSLQKDEPYELPAPQHGWLAIVRADFRLYMHELESWQYDFLLACRDGVSVYEAALAISTQRPVSELLADLWLWLPMAMEQRLLVVV